MTIPYQPTVATVDALPATTRPTADDAVLAAARGIESIIAEHAATTERNRRLAPPVVDALRAAGLFRLFTPRALGGLEVDPVTFARVVEEVSTFDSAAGWTFQVNTGAWWTSRMSPEGVAELYADGPDLMMAASFAPPHRAEEVPGGYRITGRSPLASTIHDSRWALMSAIVFDGDEPRMTPAGPDFISVVLRTTEVEIIDTWDSLGMRGTDSHDVEAKGVFVPESRAFRFEPDSVASAPFDGPLYRMPALAATFPIIAPVALAIASGAIRELRDIVITKVPLGSMKTARDRTAVQAGVAEAEAMVRSARLFFHDALAKAWERAVAQKPFTLEDKAGLMLASTWAVRQRGSGHRPHAPHGRHERDLRAEQARTSLPGRADRTTPRLRFGQSFGNRRAGVSRRRAGVSVRGVLTGGVTTCVRASQWRPSARYPACSYLSTFH